VINVKNWRYKLQVMGYSEGMEWQKNLNQTKLFFLTFEEYQATFFFMA